MTDNLGTSKQELLSGEFVEIINLSDNEHDVEFIVIENQAIRRTIALENISRYSFCPRT